MSLIMRMHYGLLLGVWLAVNIGVYRLLVSSGWPSGAAAPAGIRVDVFDLFPASVRAAIVALALVAPVLFVAAWRYLERATGIDAAAVSAAARWCARALARPASIAVAAAVVVLLMLPAIDEIFWFGAFPAMAFVLLLPLGVFSAPVAASPDGAGWWKPRWPGLGPLIAVLLLFVVMGAAESGMSALSSRFPGVAALTAVLAAAVGMVALALQGSILLFGLAPAEAPGHVRQLVTWRRLGPVVAVHARVLLLSLFILAPLVTGALLLWKLLPSHAAWAASRGAELSWSGRALATAGAGAGMSGTFVVFFVLGLPLLMMVSRVLWETRLQAEAGAGR